MTQTSVILALVVVTALAFDFTNGFHDTANAMATTIATKALRPKTAVALSGLLNLVGAFLSVQVALTVTNAVVKIQNSNGTPKATLTAHGGEGLLLIVLAGLVGGIVWNLATWLLGLPSSSSHALFGGLIGATIAGLGWAGVNWNGDGSKLDGVVGKVLLPAILSPVIAGVVSAVGTWLVYRAALGVAERFTTRGFRWGQIGSASLVSLAHGTNDAQKTMGVITLALIASGDWTDTKSIPLWVKVACAVAIALGTYLGGWRIIRTMGKGLVDIAPAQGTAAQSASAAVILASSHLGFALSTTHVATGSIVGSGLGQPGATVRWRVAGRMVLAWLITLPAAALVGALMWWIGDLIGGLAGAITVFVLLLAAATGMWLRSRRLPIGEHNVNDDWDANFAQSTEPAPDLVTVAAVALAPSAPAAAPASSGGSPLPGATPASPGATSTSSDATSASSGVTSASSGATSASSGVTSAQVESAAGDVSAAAAVSSSTSGAASGIADAAADSPPPSPGSPATPPSAH